MKVNEPKISHIPKISELGYSMTSDIMPEMIREDGITAPLVAELEGTENLPENFLYLGANGDKFAKHIDIVSHQYSLVYDLKSPRSIETAYISTFHHSLIDYTIGEFEIYASNCRENLFEKENRIIYHDNRNCQEIGKPRNHADFIFECEDLTARYVAFRQLNTNSPDKFSRIKNICFYGKEFTFQRSFLVNEKLSGSCIEGVFANDDNRHSVLTDGVVFDDFDTALITDEALTFELKNPRKIDHIAVVSKGDCTFEISCDDKAVKFTTKAEEVHCGRILHTCDLDTCEISQTLTVSIKGDATLDQITAYCCDRQVEIDSENILNHDFLGIGANVIPCHLFQDSRMRGFTEQYFELEKRRIAVAHPQVVRLWFQLDWFIMNEQGYLNREYCFETPKMRALYKELDAFLEADVEVEFNFGWKIGYDAQKWFSFPDVYNRKNSAPKNLDAFATACSDCLRELIVNRGYTNIKYLAFYNEPNNSHQSGGDFTCPIGYDVLAYWCKMMERCDEQLKKDGLRHLVKIWGAESNSRDIDRKVWPEYLNTHAPNAYEYLACHCYYSDYSEAMQRGRVSIEASGNHPVIISEFAIGNYGHTDGIDFNFERTNQACVLGFMNIGISGALYWILSGCYIDEHIFLDNPNGTLWQFPTEISGSVGINGVTKQFYELSLLTNYIPRHSTVVSTTVSDEGMHATAVKTPSGGYTVVVELRDGGKFNRNIKVAFGTDVNMKFRRHCYRLGTECEPNMIIPPVEKELEVGSVLCDTVDGNYGLYVYTTEPPKPQVVMEKCEVFVKPGETIQLNARIIDGEGPLKWSIPENHCNLGYPGTVTPDGVYTASDVFYVSRVECGIQTDFAVKAELPTGEYGIVIVKVRN